MLECYRDHRIDVIRRRTRFLLRKAEERLHILDGLRLAVQNIDEVVEIIKKSANVDEARSA
jgi:DNA gyrase subunit A